MLMQGATSKVRSALNSKPLLLQTLALELLFSTLVLLDIPVARQLFVFIYLTVFPGYIILRVLNPRNRRLSQTILYSIGFSLAFLMIGGLLINVLGPLAGVSAPLSEIPILIVLNIMMLFLSLASTREEQRSTSIISNAAKTIVKAPFVLVFFSLPMISIVGSIWNNLYNDNSILLFMIAMIAVLFVASLLSKKLAPSKLYPLIVLTIAIALLFNRSLVSNYVQSGGSDVHNELTVLERTKNNGYWSLLPEQFSGSSLFGRYNDMLSVTVLPTVISSLMSVNPEWVVKLLIPLLFSFVPVALYSLWENQFGPKIALVSAFFFVAEQTFYTEMPGLVRQMIGELFFVLLFTVLLSKESKPKKLICFIVFSSALIMSHYSLSLIFLFFLFFPLLIPFFMRRRTPSTKVTLTMIVLFSVLMFSWYIYTSRSTTFDSILEYGNYVFGQLGEWSNPAARGTVVLRGLGLEAAPSIWNIISRAIAYIEQFLIVFGFIGVISKRVKLGVDSEYFYFTLPSITLLVALILVPGLSMTINMTRFYHILLFFLAPLCALGADFLVRIILRNKVKLELAFILLLLVLVPYFLFQTNFVYEVTRSESWSLPLSGYRMDPLQLYASYAYIDEQSAFGGNWLRASTDAKYTQLYVDNQALTGAMTYCGIPLLYRIEVLSNTTTVTINGTAYLNRLNTAYGVVVGTIGGVSHEWNMSQLPYLNRLDVVYSNGGSEVLRNP